MFLRKTLAVAMVVGAGLLGAGEARACQYLEMQLMQLQAGGISPGEEGRARMLRNRLVKEGCRRGEVVESAPRRPGRAERRSREALAGERRSRSDRGRTAAFMKARGGKYTTMCVRTCDGYYFPISFATRRERFADDAAACAARCPAAGTMLFYHVALDERPAEMRALDGMRYADLPNAFRHRLAYDSGCTCGTPSATALGIAGLIGGHAEALPEPSASRPLRRPAPGTDPETLADRAGGLSLPLILASRMARRAPAAAGPGEIRVVGPIDRTVTLLTPIP